MPLEWPEFETNDRQYLEFGAGAVEVLNQDEDLRDRFYWWNYVFPELTAPPNNRRQGSRHSMMKSSIFRYLSNWIGSMSKLVLTEFVKISQRPLYHVKRYQHSTLNTNTASVALNFVSFR